MYRVSLIFPLHNLGSACPDLLRKVQATIGSEDEVIFVDDFSSDSTFTAIKNLAPRDDRYTLIRHSANMGPGPARTTGLSVARGKYVWFPDWDDTWSKDILDRMVNLAEEREHDMVIVGATRNWSDRAVAIETAPTGKTYDGSKLMRDLVSGRRDGFLWNKLFFKERIAASSFPAVRTQEDLAFLLQNSRQFKSIGVITDTLYQYVQHSGSLTNAALPNFDGLQRCLKILADSERPKTEMRLFEVSSLLATAISRATLGDSSGFHAALGRIQLELRDLLILWRLPTRRLAQLLLAKTLSDRYLNLHKALTSPRKE